ncbi:MAG: RcnB family protein [Sphingomonas sp.]|jgi:Ni/Co efflux regulator RcnB
MRKPIILALAAAALVPAMAQAQSAGELRRDRQEIHQQQRELHQAYRKGDNREVRREARDVAQAREEYREDLRDHRRVKRYEGRAPAWQAPFRYTAFRPGLKIAPAYYHSRYAFVDARRYNLPPARAHQRWVRHYGDVVLVDTRHGVVINVVRGFYR